jgi:hypothetical protein
MGLPTSIPIEPFEKSKAAIDDLTRDFFKAFEPKPDGKVDLSAIRRLFIPEGLIIKTCGGHPEIYSLQQFIEPRQRILNDGTLSDFHEREVTEETRIFGQIACRWSLYQKWGKLSGQAFEAKGMKTIHFIRMPEGWRMNSLIWDDERDGLKISEE